MPVLVSVTEEKGEREEKDETLVLGVALMQQLPLRECELLPEPLRVAELVGQ